MKYTQVLSSYLPVEEGDFFIQYVINEMGYVLYSPAKGKLSCIELQQFTDITAEQLAVYINWEEQEDADVEEITFDESVTKADLLAYLADVSNQTDNGEYFHNVSPYSGFALLDNKGATKNLFDIRDDCYTLCFDNTLSFLTNKNSDKQQAFVCFSPTAYRKLIGKQEINSEYFVCLFPTANPFFLELIREKTISVLIEKNHLELFAMLVYFINRNTKQLDFFNDGKLITVAFYKQPVEDIINLSALSDKKLKAKYGNFKVCYSMNKVDETTFISFRNNNGLLEAFVAAFCEINLFNYSINIVQ